mgnify:CR=1 FL=1
MLKRGKGTFVIMPRGEILLFSIRGWAMERALCLGPDRKRKRNSFPEGRVFCRKNGSYSIVIYQNNSTNNREVTVMEFQGKVVLVAGATSGIGEATAAMFAQKRGLGSTHWKA